MTTSPPDKPHADQPVPGSPGPENEPQPGPVGPGPQSPQPQSPGPQSPHPQGPGPIAAPAAGQQPPGGWSAPMPAAPSFQGRPASFGARLLAAFVDALIIGAPSLALFGLLGALGVGAFGGDDGSGAGVVAFVLTTLLTLLVLVVVGFLYAPLVMARQGAHNGQTFGKQLAGIRVVRADGRPMTFGSSAVREVGLKGVAGAILTSTGILFLVVILNYLWPLWDDENRALHDMAAATRVVAT